MSAEERAKAFAGLGAFLWYTDPAMAAGHGLGPGHVSEGGDLDRIAARCREAGFAWLAVKTGDYATSWPRQLRDVRALRERGIACYTWVYCRHDDVAGEAAMIREAIAAGGAVILATEAECEGKPEAAEEILRRVRDQAPDAPIAYAPLPVIHYHQALPYVQYNQNCDAVLPQFYVAGLGRHRWPIETLLAEWAEWSYRWRGAGRPVPPIYPVIEGCAPDDLLDEVVGALRDGFDGLSVWEWAQMPPRVWPRLAALDRHSAERGAAPDGPERADFDSERVRTQLDAMWGYAMAAQSAVAALKAELGVG